jgi:hypothetical protein
MVAQGYGAAPGDLPGRSGPKALHSISESDTHITLRGRARLCLEPRKNFRQDRMFAA